MKLLLILSIPLLTISHPTESPVYPLPLPGYNRAVYFEWTPSAVPSNPAKPLLLFNHFFKSPEATFRTYYIGTTYTQPILQLSLGTGHLIVNSKVLPPFKRGRTYSILVFWRRVPGGTEACIMLDGRIVGHKVGPFCRATWLQPLRVGARDLIPVNDPTFPSCQHVDGQLKNFVIVEW